jgi:hypothetical protein
MSLAGEVVFSPPSPQLCGLVWSGHRFKASTAQQLLQQINIQVSFLQSLQVLPVHSRAIFATSDGNCTFLDD